MEQIRKRMEQLTDDELRKAVTVDADQYRPEAIPIAWEELRKRGVTDVPPAEVERVKARDRAKLTTGWITAYSVLMAVAALLTLWGIGNSGNVPGIVAGTVFVVAPDLLIAYGLLRRRAWAWSLNRVFLVISGFASTANMWPDLVLSLVGLIMAMGLWVLPNLVYFNKRRDLFH